LRGQWRIEVLLNEAVGWAEGVGVEGVGVEGSGVEGVGGGRWEAGDKVLYMIQGAGWVYVYIHVHNITHKVRPFRTASVHQLSR